MQFSQKLQCRTGWQKAGNAGTPFPGRELWSQEVRPIQYYFSCTVYLQLKRCSDKRNSLTCLTRLTRFANSIRFVLSDLRNDHAAIHLVLVNHILVRSRVLAPRTALKQRNAKLFSDKYIHVLSLSGRADIYSIFGVFLEKWN